MGTTKEGQGTAFRGCLLGAKQWAWGRGVYAGSSPSNAWKPSSLRNSPLLVWQCALCRAIRGGPAQTTATGGTAADKGQSPQNQNHENHRRSSVRCKCIGPTWRRVENNAGGMHRPKRHGGYTGNREKKLQGGGRDWGQAKASRKPHGRGAPKGLQVCETKKDSKNTHTHTHTQNPRSGTHNEMPQLLLIAAAGAAALTTTNGPTGQALVQAWCAAAASAAAGPGPTGDGLCCCTSQQAATLCAAQASFLRCAAGCRCCAWNARRDMWSQMVAISTGATTVTTKWMDR